MVHPNEISVKRSKHNYKTKYDHYEYGVQVNSDEKLNQLQLRLATLDEMFKNDQLNSSVYMELSKKAMEDHMWGFMTHLWIALAWGMFIYYLQQRVWTEDPLGIGLRLQ